MREMSIVSVEDGRAKYVTDDYLTKVINRCYPWLAIEQENAIKARIDKWNQLFGNKK